MSILPQNVVIPSVVADTSQATNPHKVGKNPVFDFSTGEFVRTATGRVATVEGAESLKLWIQKAIITPRGVFFSYSDDFGNEVFTLVGVPVPDQVLFMEIERLCREALIYDPRIEDVGEFTFSKDADFITVSFKVTHIEGLADITLGIEVK